MGSTNTRSAQTGGAPVGSPASSGKLDTPAVFVTNGDAVAAPTVIPGPRAQHRPPSTALGRYAIARNVTPTAAPKPGASRAYAAATASACNASPVSRTADPMNASPT